MAKRSGPYKRYLEMDAGKIPRTTQYRWNLAKKRKEACKFNYENEDVDTLQNMENIREADRAHTADNLSSVHNFGDKDGEIENSATTMTINESHQNITECEDHEDNESSTATTNHFDVDIQENEKHPTESDDFDATSTEDENNLEELECSSSEESPSELAVANEETDEKPLCPGSPVSKGESLLMLMSYLLRHNLTDLAAFSIDCQKREAFKKGEDIWKREEDRGGKRKIKPNSRWMDNEEESQQSKKQNIEKASYPSKEAADQMIEDLTKDLMERLEDLESPTQYEESSDDELPSRNWSKAQKQIKQLTAENKRLKEDNFKHLIEATKELPAVVQNLRDITELLSSTLSSASSGSTPVQTPVQTPARSELQLSASTSPKVDSTDLVSLVPSSDVKVPRQKLGSLRTSNPSVYIGDLAVLVYGRETLSGSSLTGRQSGAHKDLESKPQLDGTKLDAILGHALSKFPGTSVQDVRRIIRKKCNNESYKQASAKKSLDI